MSSFKLLTLLALVLFISIPAGLARAQDASIAGSGTAVISDGLALSDVVTFSMTGVTIPAEGTAYEGWLVSDDGSVKLSAGILTVTAAGGIDHQFVSADAENFIANYDKVVITEEPVPDADPGPSDVVLFIHQVPSPGMANIRHLLTEAGSEAHGFAQPGHLPNLKAQLDVAIVHVNLALNSTTLDDVRKHTHHVINIIEGEGGPNFDDSFGNPGDGVGVPKYAQDSASHAAKAAAAAPGDAVIAANGDLVESYSKNAEDWANLARDQAVDSLAVDSISGAKTLMSTVGAVLQDALDGIDATGEGGADQAYVSAQEMATYTMPSPAPAAAPRLPVTGDATVPLIAQLALIAALVSLSAGGLILVRARRSRSGS